MTMTDANNNNNNNNNNSIPKAAHPTAKAFFDALDSKSSSSKQSETLKRRSCSLGWRNRYSQDSRYPVRIKGISFSVQQVQRGEVEGTYGTGATVWPAAMVLIKYLEKHSECLKGKRVVDLGSGTGVTSLAAAVLGATQVICTDGEESVVQLAFENINDAVDEIAHSKKGEAKDATTTTTRTTSPVIVHNCPLTVRKYWWGDGSMKDSQCNVVLVADCVLPKLYPIAPLVIAIDQLLTSESALAILSYEHRYYPDYDPRDKFRELADSRGLKVENIPAHEMDEVYCVEDIEIWHVTRK